MASKLKASQNVFWTNSTLLWVGHITVCLGLEATLAADVGIFTMHSGQQGSVPSAYVQDKTEWHVLKYEVNLLSSSSRMCICNFSATIYYHISRGLYPEHHSSSANIRKYNVSPMSISMQLDCVKPIKESPGDKAGISGLNRGFPGLRHLPNVVSIKYLVS